MTSTSEGATFAASSPLYELVVKATSTEGERLVFTAFLSDYRTNEPVRRATLAIELLGAGQRSIPFQETEAAGVYRSDPAEAPPGPSDVLATIRTSSGEELLTVKGYDPRPAASGRASPDGSRWAFGAIGGAALLAIAVLVAAFGRRRPAALAGLLVVAFGSLSARARAQGDTPFTKEAQFLLGIRTLPAAERELQPRLSLLGTVVARSDGQAEIRAPSLGRIVPVDGRLPVVGDAVRAGQPLLAVDQALGASEQGALASQALRAQAELAQAAARLAQAEQELRRLQSLGGIASEREVKAAETAVEVARQDRARARAEAELYGGGGRGLGRQVLRSPITGTVVQARVAAGELVDPERLLVSVVDLSRLWAEAEVYEADLHALAPGAPALLAFEGEAAAVPARLFRPGQSVSRITRTAQVLFELENPDGRIKPGMLCDVAVSVGERSRGLAVPAQAVVEQEGRSFVFVHVAPEWFDAREVRTGRRDGDWVEVVAGLGAGERVAVSGVGHLRNAGR
jgi:cobalt-zinc-cadmium efflux system membrane fusion protein